MVKFLYSHNVTVLYMFRAILCSSSGGQIVCIQHIVSSLSMSDRGGRTVHSLHDHPYYRVCLDILSLVGDPLSGNGCCSPNHTFIHSVFCLTTGPKPPPKRFLHIVRSRASSFK